MGKVLSTILFSIASFFMVIGNSFIDKPKIEIVPENQTEEISLTPAPTLIPTPIPTKRPLPTTPHVDASKIRQTCSEKTQKYIDEKIMGKNVPVNSAVTMINANYSLCITSYGLPPENMVSGGNSSVQGNTNQGTTDTINDFKNTQNIQCQNDQNKYNNCLQEYNIKMQEYQNCMMENTNPYIHCSKPMNFCYKPPSCF